MAPSRTNASKAGPASSSAAAGGHHHTPSSAYMRTRTRSTPSGLTGPKSQSNQEQPTTPSSSLINAAGSTSTQRGPRTVKKREIHNAVERDRRNKLNERFLDLAAKLPATASVRRPSKNLVIIKSLQFVTDALNHETTYRAMIEQLLRENAAMRSEINEARLAHGTPALLLPASGLVMPATLVEIGRASHNGSSRGPRMRSGSSALLGRTDDDEEDEEDDGEEDEEDDGHEMAEDQGQGQGEAEGRSAQAGTEVHGQASSSDPLSGFFSRRTSDEEAQDFASFLGGQPQQQPFQFGQQQQQQQQQGMPHMQPPEAYGATGTPALFGSPFVGAQQQQNADAHSHFSSSAFAHHHQPQPQHQAQHQPARHASFSGFDLRPSTAAGEGAHSHQTGGGGGSGIFQPFRSLGLDGQAIGGNASAAGAGAATTTTSSPSPAAHGGSSSHGGAAPSSSSPSSYPSIFGFGSASAPAATGAVHGQQSERQRQQPSSPAATSASPLSGAAGGQQQQQCDLDFAGSEWLSMATAAAAAAHSLNHATHLPPPSDQCSSASSSSPLTAYSPGSSRCQSDMSSSASSTSSSPPRFPAEDGMGAYPQAAAAGSLFFGDFLVPPPVGAGSFAFLPQQQHQQQQQHELGGDYKVPHGIEGCGAGFDAVAFLNTLVPPPPAPAPMALSI
ncbi:hypothetical protein OC842_005358 [Tilletia horrida]|uniref:BHLH domain-containing protein n=1 Tax=Tilletia horrida TaxID=155126 RepID=A0AAN6G818_9BASI|nr:hypothetical protein OC842_005358 [Tilletia horrida]